MERVETVLPAFRAVGAGCGATPVAGDAGTDLDASPGIDAGVLEDGVDRSTRVWMPVNRPTPGRGEER